MPKYRIAVLPGDGVGVDVMEAAYVLRGVVPHYPSGTVHLVVVDPGVGSKRRCVAVRKGDQRLVGPDNGIFSLLLDGREPDELVELNHALRKRDPRIVSLGIGPMFDCVRSDPRFQDLLRQISWPGLEK